MPRPPHIYGSCHFEDCPACERVAEARRDDHDADIFGWEADRMADAYERAMDREWGDAS